MALREYILLINNLAHDPSSRTQFNTFNRNNRAKLIIAKILQEEIAPLLTTPLVSARSLATLLHIANSELSKIQGSITTPQGKGSRFVYAQSEINLLRTYTKAHGMLASDVDYEDDKVRREVLQHYLRDDELRGEILEAIHTTTDDSIDTNMIEGVALPLHAELHYGGER